MPAGNKTYLFLHLMKTGGTSFLAHIEDNFPPGTVYPDDRTGSGFSGDGIGYGSVQRLRAACAEQPHGLRVVSGHFPHLVSRIVQPDIVLTILRDPVDRAISMLRQFQGVEGNRDRSLEDIYDQEPLRMRVIQDYQVRQFALTPEELQKAGDDIDVFFPGRGAPAIDVPHYVHVPMDDGRLARAVEVATSVDVIGLQSHYGLFLAELEGRFDWSVARAHSRRTAPRSEPVPPALRRRIAEDNPYDVEFYERMRAVVLGD